MSTVAAPVQARVAPTAEAAVLAKPESPQLQLRPDSQAPVEGTQKSLIGVFQKLGPLLLSLGNVINIVEPYFEAVLNWCLATWASLAPYHPEELVEAVFGLFLCFFGGHYVITLAAIEAYRMCGWTTTITYLTVIWEDYKLVRDASKKDDLVDKNKDGVADVRQITKQQLFTRKMKLAAKSCNPEKLTMALGGLYTGFMGVVATLRVQFAQTVTLGAVIGSTFSSVAQRLLQPVLLKVIPNQYAKWVPVIIDLTCKSIGVSIAWFVQRVISAFYSAVRGAQIFSRGVLCYATRHKYIAESVYDESSWHYAALTFGLAAAGFLWQFANFMSLPFPFNVVFFPLTIIEWILNYFVAFETL